MRLWPAFWWVLLLVLLLPQRGHTALPAGEIWREQLLNFRIGFGRNATGGAGGTLCTVTNLNDAGAGSLRNCAGSNNQWIIFSVSGTITLNSFLDIYGSNITIDGRGQTILINNFGIRLSGASNIIVHDIQFTPVFVGATDALRLIGGAHTIWIDHVECSHEDDECIDIGATGGVTNDAAYDITVSWSHFFSPNVSPVPSSGTNLICSDIIDTQCAAMTVTLHHNWYDHTYVRHPLARYATMHSFNNWFDHNDIGAQASQDSKFFSENDLFDGQPGGYPRVHCDPYGPTGTNSLLEGPSLTCKVTNPWLVTGSETYEQRNQASSFDPHTFYPYTPETPNAALRTKLSNTTTGAGAVSNPYNTLSGGATQVVVTVQPSTVVANAIMADWTVEARDASNVLDTAFSGTLSFALGANPGGGVLTGTTSGVFTAGVATWCCDVRISQPGVGYTFVVTAPGLTGVTTAPFTVTAPAATVPLVLRLLK